MLKVNMSSNRTFMELKLLSSRQHTKKIMF